MAVSEETYLRVALEDPKGQWELHCGQLRSKPNMTAEHDDQMFELGYMLRLQLDRSAFRVRVNAGRVRRSATEYCIPDVLVIPTAVELTQRVHPPRVEVYSEPLPLVVEIWSRSTGEYDRETKVPDYQRRGDLEIWQMHPYRHTVTVWRRQPDGSYATIEYEGGIIELLALLGVRVDLDQLFSATS